MIYNLSGFAEAQIFPLFLVMTSLSRHMTNFRKFLYVFWWTFKQQKSLDRIRLRFNFPWPYRSKYKKTVPMESKVRTIIAQVSKYKIYDKSEWCDPFNVKHIKNVKFLSGSRGPNGPDLP